MALLLRIALGAMLVGACWMAAAAEVVLVKDGRSLAPIVLAADAPPMTREAAELLADCIETMSGARPDILEEAPDPLPPSAIWIGVQPKLRELMPSLDFDFQHPEEILIAASEQHVVIAGRDRYDPEHLVVKTAEGTIDGKQQEYGTANAVYTFLQDQLQVRWLWPGELGDDMLQRRTIALEPMQYRYHPQIRSRGGALHFSSLGERGYGRSHEWTRRQRLQLHSLEMGGGHGFGDWWDRFHEKHPEYFALQPDGTRSGFPNPGNAKLCQSNPAVWQQWMSDVEDDLARDPNLTVFNASPNDGWSTGHCVCENCRAWDHVDGEPRLFHWHHYRELRPALTDRDVTFANRLAELLKQRYPERDYYVLMMSYGHSRPAPIEARPAENVIISSVANFYGRANLVDRGSTRGVTHRQQFEAWSPLVSHLMWRPNTGSPAGWQQGLPDVSIEQTIDDLQLVGASRCVGIFIDSVWEHWATQGPQYYITAQLAWNHEQDAQALLDDYYQRAFGPAAPHVRAYFETIEQARMQFVDQHGYESGVLNFPNLYTKELLEQCAAHLERAAAEAREQRPIYGQRVEFIAAGLQYTRLLVETITLMDAYWRQPSDAVAQRVRDNWAALERLAAQHPHAINWGPVRPSTPRMAGLHPDYPNPKLKPKPAADLDLN